jgi:hypothetical protein
MTAGENCQHNDNGRNKSHDEYRDDHHFGRTFAVMLVA